MNARLGPTLTEQVWIEKRLGRPGLLDGKTNDEIFRSRFQAHLIKHGLHAQPAGKKGGVEETWSALYARLYGAPLETAQP